MHIKLKDLPTPQFPQPRSRRVYAAFWAPFDVCCGVWASYQSFLLKGFAFSAVCNGALLALMYFTGGLTTSVLFGVAVATLLAGAGFAALFALISALR